MRHRHLGADDIVNNRNADEAAEREALLVRLPRKLAVRHTLDAERPQLLEPLCFAARELRVDDQGLEEPEGRCDRSVYLPSSTAYGERPPKQPRPIEPKPKPSPKGDQKPNKPGYAFVIALPENLDLAE